MTIDDVVFQNPGSNSTYIAQWVTAFSVIITGSSSGNGTFTLADFGDVFLDTNSGTLDLTLELVGQNSGGLFDPANFLGGGSGGDFNMSGGSAPAPQGTAPGEFTTDGGSGDVFSLTSIAPLLFPFAKEDRKCVETIGKVGGKYVAARHKVLSKCRSALMKGKALFEDEAKTIPVTNAANCPDELKSGLKIAKARQKVRDGLDKKCTDAILANLFACAPTVDGLADATGSNGCIISAVDTAVDSVLFVEFGF